MRIQKDILVCSLPPVGRVNEALINIDVYKMTEAAQINLKIVASSYTAGLRVLIEHCDDRDTARRIYSELRNLSHRLAVKHGFMLHKGKSNVESNRQPRS